MAEQSSVVVTHTPGVVITQEVMYAEVRATHDAVVVLGEEVKKIGDHEHRLRSVERRMWIASGAATALGSLFGIIGSRVIP